MERGSADGDPRLLQTCTLGFCRRGSYHPPSLAAALELMGNTVSFDQAPTSATKASALPLLLSSTLILLRLWLSPRGATLLFSDSHDYIREAGLSVGDLLAGRYGSIPAPRAIGYPLVLKVLGVTRVDAPLAVNTIVPFQVLVSTLSLALLLWVGRRLISSNFGWTLWATFCFIFSLTDFILPWEACALTETLSTNGLLLLSAQPRCPGAGQPSCPSLCLPPSWPTYARASSPSSSRSLVSWDLPGSSTSGNRPRRWIDRPLGTASLQPRSWGWWEFSSPSEPMRIP